MSSVLCPTVSSSRCLRRSRRGRLNTSAFAQLAPELPELELVPLSLVSLNGFLLQGMYGPFFNLKGFLS